MALLFMISCNKRTIQYPETKKVDQKDVYFGVEVADPYRWLEDDRSQETEQWVKAQNEVTFSYLAKISYRDKVKERLTSLWNFETMQAPFKKADKYFFFKNNGLQNQDVLYMQNSLTDEPKVLLDPNTLSEDGTIALGGYSVSNDGKYLAYQISKGGSDWNEIFIKNIETGQDLEDHIKWVKFSGIAWYKDGFFYSRYEEPTSGSELSEVNKYQKVYYHKIGTPSDKDDVIYENQEYSLRNYRAQVSLDEKYLFIYETQSTNGNNLYVKNLHKNDNFVKLTTGFNYEYAVLDHVDNNLIVLTNYNAPKYKLVRINVNSLDIGNWVDIIPEKKDVLTNCRLAGGKIIASYLQDAQTKLEVYNIKGDYLSDIELPAIGTVGRMNGLFTENEVFFSFVSFTIPSTVYVYNTEEGSVKSFFEPKIDFDITKLRNETGFLYQ
ncbi:MAG: hypothetical protein MZV63_30955 [Marinilabiliales bacterium]|nr:hypothetical protein [Marinilabiliales bacterium]